MDAYHNVHQSVVGSVDGAVTSMTLMDGFHNDVLTCTPAQVAIEAVADLSTDGLTLGRALAQGWRHTGGRKGSGNRIRSGWGTVHRQTGDVGLQGGQGILAPLTGGRHAGAQLGARVPAPVTAAHRSHIAGLPAAYSPLRTVAARAAAPCRCGTGSCNARNRRAESHSLLSAQIWQTHQAAIGYGDDTLRGCGGGRCIRSCHK